ESNPPQIAYSSPQGLKTLLETAQDHLPFIPHDFAIEVAAQILDQQDVLVRTACGSGKTRTIALIAVLLEQLKRNAELSRLFKVWFPDNAVILTICPTDALELNMECSIRK
ncbi:hypothetical protein Moror_12333, partial [Moniliophthora roreri MCA 2997]